MVRGGRTGDERGAVTAETAMALPVLLVVMLAMVWLVTVGLVQMQVTDASREAARALARGESVEQATGLARQAAPGSVVTTSVRDGLVVVRVERAVAGPGGALAGLPGAEVRSESTALAEQ
jgi:Flp pilus assembly protein TadG